MYRIKKFTAQSLGKQELFRVQKRRLFFGIIPYWSECGATKNTLTAFFSEDAARNSMYKDNVVMSGDKNIIEAHKKGVSARNNNKNISDNPYNEDSTINGLCKIAWQDGYNHPDILPKYLFK